MSKLVFATGNTYLTDADGMGYRVIANSPWDADDPLVKRHPGEFSAEPRVVMRTAPAIEQATAGPGETRKRVG